MLYKHRAESLFSKDLTVEVLNWCQCVSINRQKSTSKQGNPGQHGTYCTVSALECAHYFFGGAHILPFSVVSAIMITVLLTTVNTKEDTALNFISEVLSAIA